MHACQPPPQKWGVNTHGQYSGRSDTTQSVGWEERVLGVEFGVVLVGDLLVRTVKVLDVIQVKIDRSDIRVATCIHAPQANLNLVCLSLLP